MDAGMWLVLTLLAAGVVTGAVCLTAAAIRDRRGITDRRRARAAASRHEQLVSPALASTGRSRR